MSKIALHCEIKDLFQDVIKTIKRIMETDISQTFVHCAARELDRVWYEECYFHKVCVE